MSSGSEKDAGPQVEQAHDVLSRLSMDPKHEGELVDAKGQVSTGVADVLDHFTLDEAREFIQAFVTEHEMDVNMDRGLIARASAALSGKGLTDESARDLVEELRLESALILSSPYAEVRAVVSETDDPNMPVSTFRSWLLAMIFTTIGTGVNIFFAARNPSITLNTFCAQVRKNYIEISIVVSSPLLASLFFRSLHILACSLNPGRFNLKEHIFITVAANVTFGGINGVYATDVIAVQRLGVYFSERSATNPGYQILMVLSTQMIWPATLATVALNRSFHDSKESEVKVPGWRISRMRFFLIVFVSYGLYFVLPQAVFSATEYFNWITWISPNNVKLALIAGSIGGIGLTPIATLDWSYISALSNPLITPLFSTANQFAGMFFVCVCLVTPVYFANKMYMAYLPINSADLFDRFGSNYNVSSVMSDDFSLNITAFEAYSPAYQSSGNAFAFLAYFALYPATLVHVGLYYRKELATAFRSLVSRKSIRESYQDSSNRLMKNYKEVPDWWFLAVTLISLALGLAYNEVYKTQLPAWAIFFCLALGAIFIIPCGIIQATTNSEVTLNVISEIIAGYTLPNRPVANLLFKNNISYYSQALMLAYIFQGRIRRNSLAWWSKYNYILATGLTSAISIFGVIWFFSIIYKGYTPDWWGNDVPFAGSSAILPQTPHFTHSWSFYLGCDNSGCPLLPIPDIGYFGPGVGEF
ncbi:hypothetical protein P7C70_g5914, partial [Phenoliferia sp. Uapishka_3]